MPPVGAAIGAAISAVAASTILTNIALGIGLSFLTRAFAPKPDAPKPVGMREDQTLTGGINPEAFVLGTAAVQGAFAAPPMTSGSTTSIPNAYLDYVIEVAGIPGHELIGYLINDEQVEILEADPDPDGGKRIGGRYEGHAWIKYYDGTQTEADPFLSTRYGSRDIRPWTTDAVGTGICYAHVSFKYNREIFQGFPRVGFVLRGMPVYDPRKDSTAGGSGSQRWDDPSSWEHSDNNVVLCYNVLRGITLPSGDVWGGGVPGADLHYDIWAPQMDKCDVQVDDGAGGTEPRYRAGIEVYADDEPFDVIDELMKACFGTINEFGGVWYVHVGEPALPVFAFTDDDILADSEEAYSPFPSIEQVFNGIEATYPDPEAGWQARDAEPVYNPEWEAEDDGRRLVASVQFSACPYPAQAQRLMCTMIRDHRRMRSHVVTLPPEASVLQVMDTVAWTSAHNGYDAKLFQVHGVSVDLVTRRTEVSLREADPDDHENLGEITLPPPVDNRPQLTPVQGVPGWTVEPHTIRDDDNDARRPALRLTWTASEVEDARGIRWAIRFQGDSGEGEISAIHDASAGEAIVELLPNIAYEVRARIIAERPTEWSSWRGAVTPNVGLAEGDFDTLPLPLEVTGITITSRTDTLPGGAQTADVYVSWAIATNAASYELEAEGVDGTGTRGKTTIEPQADFQSPPVKQWRLRVRGLNALGRPGPWSGWALHTTRADNVPPAAVQNLHTKPSFSQAWLAWDANTEPDLSHYEIYESASSATPGSGVAGQFSTRANSFVRSAPDGISYYRVRAVDTSGNAGPWTAAVEVNPALASIEWSDLGQDVIDQIDSVGDGLIGLVQSGIFPGFMAIPDSRVEAFGTTATAGLPLDYNTSLGTLAHYGSDEDGPYIEMDATSGHRYTKTRGLAAVHEDSVVEVVMRVRASEPMNLQIRTYFINPDGSNPDTYAQNFNGTPGGEIVELRAVFARQPGDGIDISGGSAELWNNCAGLRVGLKNNAAYPGGSYRIYSVSVRDLTSKQFAHYASISEQLATQAASDAGDYEAATRNYRDEAAASVVSANDAASQATQSAGVAADARNDAEGFAQASAQDASDAAAAANASGQSANAAQNSRVAAETARGQAEGFANTSVAAKEDAEDAAAAAQTTLGVMASVDRDNLIPNGYFKDGARPAGEAPALWEQWNSRFQIVSASDAPSEFVIAISPGGYVNANTIRLPAEDGQRFYASYWYRGAGPGDVANRLQFVDAAGQTIVTHFINSNLTTADWTKREAGPYTAPAGTVQVVYAGARTNGNDSTAYLTGISLYRASPFEQDLEASSQLTQTAIADIEGNLLGKAALQVKAGSAGAELELVAFDDGDDFSSARLRADEIILQGSVTAEQLAAESVTSGKVDTDSFSASGLAVFGGSLESANYVAGSTGWRIQNNGNMELNNLVAKGWIQASAIETDNIDLNAVTITRSSNGGVVTFNSGPNGGELTLIISCLFNPRGSRQSFRWLLNTVEQTMQYVPGTGTGQQTTSYGGTLIFVDTIQLTADTDYTIRGQQRLTDGGSWTSTGVQVVAMQLKR